MYNHQIGKLVPRETVRYNNIPLKPNIKRSWFLISRSSSDYNVKGRKRMAVVIIIMALDNERRNKKVNKVGKEDDNRFTL